MEMNDAMDYLVGEGLRLQAMNMARSSVVFSAVLENGDIARMTVIVDLYEKKEEEDKKVPPPQQMPPKPQATMQQFQQRPQ